MKTQSASDGLQENKNHHIWGKSAKISKNSRCRVKLSQQALVLDPFVEVRQDVLLDAEISFQDCDYFESAGHDESLGAHPQPLKFLSLSSDFASVGEKASQANACLSLMEESFSLILESDETQSKELNPIGTGGDDELTAANESDVGSSTSHDYQTCNESKSFVSHVDDTEFNFRGPSLGSMFATTSFDENNGFNYLSTADYFPYDSIDLDKIFDTEESCMELPVLEETIDKSNILDEESTNKSTINPGNVCHYPALHHMNSLSQENVITDPSNGQEIDFDPHLFVQSFHVLSEVAQFQSIVPVWLPKEPDEKKNVTLVLDLDETLVHSSFDHCDDADFTFPVFLDMGEQTVYVKQRPHLHIFLERVAQMFDVMIFTASQSNYADQLLNKLDPEKKLISQRMYRESCHFSDGGCTKDLTVLGLDLSKVAMIDNSPQVFRLQVNNGIPIKSWFDDQSDNELISLIPFLETLVDADDVRPLIAQRFSGNKE
ncbi:Mitochondrial import inner membrane translocase subunit TIM50 [Acorus calamus]|uniref:Mitochondrial import inner membrane translocase subunit TIM50 n=1 Tax=Acorus calamus TaxID=4465 RepID=A0AAV9DC02_ACOCL|nr:Mitochondrial import inner membrane translocase subunit TIM50 [Acorus calamus]